MVAPLFEIKNLRHVYQKRPVLEIESLVLREGKAYVLLGPNGAGKSTFLRLLGLVENPTQGKILFRGETARPFSPVSRKIALLPQQPYLLKRSVFENIAFSLRIRREHGDLATRVHEALSWVGLPPEDFASRPWYALSGGEAQRVALASRLVFKPEVLLLDEPTASVDAQSAELMRRAILKARDAWGATLVIATHDWAWVNEIADHWLYLFKGRVWMENVPLFVFGPWKKEKKAWVKVFKDGSCLRLLPPENPAAEIAVWAQKRLLFCSPKGPGQANMLKFEIVSLSLKKRKGNFWVALAREDLSLILELPLKELENFTLGQEVWLSLPEKPERWL